MIQRMKDEVIDLLEGEQGDIWDTNGEGRVRYAGDKKFGNVKLVPRKVDTISKLLELYNFIKSILEAYEAYDREATKELQQWLNDNGYDAGKVDGIMVNTIQ